MRPAPIGIADVVKAADALDLRGGALAAMVEMFGFTLPSDQAPAEPRRSSEPEPDDGEDDAASLPPMATTIDALPPSARKLEPVRRATTPASAWTDPLAQSRDLPGPPASFAGLFAPRDEVSLLRFAASTPSPSDRVDVPRVVDSLSRAEPLVALPRLQVPSLALGAQLLVDVSAPMQSFWEDQQELVGRFRHALRGLADIRYVGDDPQAGAGRDRRRGSWKAYDLPRPGTPVIALTDLGCGFPHRVDAARAWLSLADRLRRRRCRLVAFAPVRVARVSPALRRAVDLVVWDRAAR
jgi:hypothetical protein